VDLLKQELSHKAVVEGVEHFEKDALRETEIDERNVLPDADTIHKEKQESELFKGIGDFDTTNLKNVSTREPVPAPQLVRQESARMEMSDKIQSFDRTELRETDTQEKVVLPCLEDITTEKQHLDMLEGLEKGVELKHVETHEPISPIEMAKIEIARDNVVDNIQEFDRSTLTAVNTEEKNLLPTAEEMKQSSSDEQLNEQNSDEELKDQNSSDDEKGAAGLRAVLLDSDRENRSSSEEWEKIGHSDLDKNTSEC